MQVHRIESRRIVPLQNNTLRYVLNHYVLERSIFEGNGSFAILAKFNQMFVKWHEEKSLHSFHFSVNCFAQFDVRSTSKSGSNCLLWRGAHPKKEEWSGIINDCRKRSRASPQKKKKSALDFKPTVATWLPVLKCISEVLPFQTQNAKMKFARYQSYSTTTGLNVTLGWMIMFLLLVQNHSCTKVRREKRKIRNWKGTSVARQTLQANFAGKLCIWKCSIKAIFASAVRWLVALNDVSDRVTDKTERCRDTAIGGRRISNQREQNRFMESLRPWSR